MPEMIGYFGLFYHWTLLEIVLFFTLDTYMGLYGCMGGVQTGIVSPAHEKGENTVLLGVFICFMNETAEEKVVLFYKKKKVWFIEEEVCDRDFIEKELNNMEKLY